MPSHDPPPLPADVRDVLAQLLMEAVGSVAAGAYDTVRDLLDTVETVVRNKVPDPEERERLLAGAATVRESLGADDDTATGYLRSMRRRVRSAST
ncbi:hypothetical protein [Halobellus ruber]|uniref:DUF8101 domain-containing protein n=1 Tax=Halobellus ruber TaxID=2761102 RepID=A0A7J9SET2_9EURY|nr:hypothetical protein [Halobellus ruber]MBB6644903.1 hypothetical protein [Halobellus ruber]